MRTIIAGSRSIVLYSHIAQAVKESGFDVTEVICGCANGADKLGFTWARKNNVPVNFFPAWPEQHQWAMRNRRPEEYVQDPMVSGKHPENNHLWRYAGFARNGLMAFYCKEGGALVSIWDRQSRGSADMIKRAKNLGLKVFIFQPEVL